MKKILIILTFLFLSLPAFAMELYNDGNYSYQTDSVFFVDNQREIFYTLYVKPTNKAQAKDKYYKARVTQYLTNGHTRVGSIYALDANNNYLHTDNTKDSIETKINNYSIVFINNIKYTFTNCREDISYLYCTPRK